ncbi:hypothetical protein A0256_22570 [Mucilaginibacter sp. PAMC 26640]|nr:hypothetical protein A0256_22570 [Mucilaginibacter sp. PAMC 26640]
MFKFNKYYFGIAVLLFNAEVLIADFMHDTIIRPYGGDFIVVILVYCMVKAFIKTGVWKTAIGTLIFAYLVEITQFFHLIDQLGWGHSALARNLLGTTFRWLDMLAYTLGIILVGLLESWLSVLKRVELRKVNG